MFSKVKLFFKNVFNYRTILCEDHDYDFAYLLILERYKLQRMIKVFKYYGAIRNTPSRHNPKVKWCKICVKLLNIILEDDTALEYYRENSTQENHFPAKFKLIKYVNISNCERFGWTKNDFNSDSRDLLKDSLRQKKALYLYNMIRYNYIYEWWD